MGSSPERPVRDTDAVDHAGRGEELRAWMVQYGPGVRRFLLKRVPPAEVDDLVQEVFLSLQARSAASAIENVEGYLFRTAVSVLARQRRRKTWRWGHQELLESVDDHLDEISPERILISREAVDRLVLALKSLPRRRAEAFALSRFQQLSNQEVARRMGISVKSVEELLRNAMNQLMDALESER